MFAQRNNPYCDLIVAQRCDFFLKVQKKWHKKNNIQKKSAGMFPYRRLFITSSQQPPSPLGEGAGGEVKAASATAYCPLPTATGPTG
jgi:hypothetical protein